MTSLKDFPEYPKNRLSLYAADIYAWKEAFEDEIHQELAKVKQGHFKIIDKNDLIHNTMKIIASTEIGILERVLGSVGVEKEPKK